MDDRLWYKNAIFYQVYVRAFKDSNGDGQGDLQGLAQKLDYLKDLGVDCVWLMPIYPSPLEDDGYDIADYCNIAEVFGTIEDFKRLLKAAHKQGIRIIMDLVMNHTSDRHPWFLAARTDRNSKFRDYYVWSDTNRKYKDARIIFVDTEPSNWTWDEMAGQYYWHRFYASQPDLNYDNPNVQEEILKTAAFWLDLGVDGFRADAVPYLFEREDTNCENLPETHAYLKKLRSFMDENYPGRILLCEANQWPEDVRPYFGDGNEFQMAFHFPIMPRIFMAIRKGYANDLVEILQRTPPIPETCQWCTFLRNHDELTLEMVTPEERQWMWEQYAPEPRMRLNLGIRRRLAPLLDNDRRKIELIYSLLFTLPGSPIIYYGDEIGMGDNISLPDRNGVRTAMQWNSNFNAGFSDAPGEKLFSPIISDDIFGPKALNVEDQQRDQNSLWNTLRRMLTVRKQYPSFGLGDIEWKDYGNNRIAAYARQFRDETVWVVQNLTNSMESITFETPLPLEFIDLLTGRIFRNTGNRFLLELEPYQYLWLKEKSTGS